MIHSFEMVMIHSVEKRLESFRTRCRHRCLQNEATKAEAFEHAAMAMTAVTTDSIFCSRRAL